MSDSSEPGFADGYERSAESEAERLDRNWAELLQELRVTQAGSQLLTGFLLTLPFQPGFSELGPEQVVVYLTLVSLAALSAILSLTPVSMHRALFRHGARRRLIDAANVALRLTLVALALTVTGTTVLIFDLVLGRTAALVVGAATLVIASVAWFLFPVLTRMLPRPARTASR